MKQTWLLLVSVLLFFFVVGLPTQSESQLKQRSSKNQKKVLPVLPPSSEGTPLQATEFHRLDPHGPRGVKPSVTMRSNDKACSVCHNSEESSFASANTARPASSESCFNCHNTGPHSGVAEHLKHQITCSSCHSPHRGDEISWKPSSGIFKKLFDQPSVYESWVDRPATSAMLKKNCTDCHNKW